MQKKKLVISSSLVILSLCFGEAAAQKSATYSQTYPKNADEVIALAETLSRVDYAINDAIKHFGTVNPASRDDEVSVPDFAILLTPFVFARNDIKRIVLYTYDDKGEARRGLDSVKVDYIQPLQLSYGELVRKLGAPNRLPLPRVKCRPGENCHPAFVGYRFSLVPGQQDANSGKRLEVHIDLEMQWSRVLPRHLDKNFLAVKTVVFKRIR